MCVSNWPVLSQRSMVIVVLSARKNFLNRKLVRQTYGSIRSVNNIHILTVVFMLGNSDVHGEELATFDQLNAEIEQYGDIVMGDFVDTYKNLTRKSIMAYEWLTSFCRQAEIVVKTDDDVLINIFKLTEELSGWSTSDIKSSNIWCCVHFNESIMLNARSQFYASLDEFPNAVFPTHCAGVGYIAPMITIDLISNEISRSFLGPVCTHEDVFMTGVVPNKVSSMANADRLRYKPIGLIEKCVDWITYLTSTERGDDVKFLSKLLQKPVNEIENLDEFQERFGKKIFFLLNHPDFEKYYSRLWQIIAKTYYGYH